MTGEFQSLTTLVSSRANLPSVTLSPERGFRLSRMDLSKLLYFSRMEDVRYIEFPDDPMTDEESSYALSELIAKFNWRSQIKIVLLPSDSLGLKTRLQALENIVLMTREDLQRCADSSNITQPLRDILRAQLDVHQLVGYQYQGAVTGNRFFGRSYQLNTLLQHPETSYLVTGTRMSGKTSLLLEAKRRIDQQTLATADATTNTVYIDCKRYSTFAGLINAVLSEMEVRTSFSHIEKWKSPQRWHAFYTYLRSIAKERADKHLHLFLDEYDQVLHIEKNEGSRTTWNFRALKETNAAQKDVIQFIIAGSKDLAKKAANRDSDLFNFVDYEGCKLDNFDVGTIKKILQRPMEDLGFRIGDPSLIAQDMMRESAGRPSSVQFICFNLVKSLLSSKKNIVTLADLHQIVHGPEYLRYYERTLHENTDTLQKFVLCAQSQDQEGRASFSQEDIIGKLRRFSVYLEPSDIIQSLDDLVNSGFLVLDERSYGEIRYILSTPVIKRIFRRSSLESYVTLLVHKGLATRIHAQGLR